MRLGWVYLGDLILKDGKENIGECRKFLRFVRILCVWTSAHTPDVMGDLVTTDCLMR